VISRLSRRPALLPPEGEEKEERQAVEPVRHRSAELSGRLRAETKCGMVTSIVRER
jgi:hypothetical protein